MATHAKNINDMSAEEIYAQLISSIESELAKGTQHFDVRGRLLTVPREILLALMDDGEIQYDGSPHHNGRRTIRWPFKVGEG